MVSKTSVSRSITSASRYHPRYQSRSSMYIRGLTPRNFADTAEAVPIGKLCDFPGVQTSIPKETYTEICDFSGASGPPTPS